MATEQVLPGVYQIGLGYVNAFLAADEELTLIDSGLPKKEETILKALRHLGGKPKDLRHIAVTHHHADHCGSLAALAEATGAATYIHRLDAPIVAGDQPRPGPNPASMAGKVLGPLIMRLPANNPRPVRVAHELEGGEELPAAGGLSVVFTPGHTAGHVSYLWPRHGGVLFAGDAAGNLFGRLGKPLGMFTEDMAQAKESIRKLAELEFDAACFGHGGALKGKAHAAFRRLVEKLAR
ncbi:MAG: MBL fold metallo-hydrolase [Dehalococcoidia bacterium]|nr:MBL fold metallo-hydrolase [Dehalococcoidia bacterium]